jgi:hypothetical protein
MDYPVTGPVGKRLSTNEPLTPHDVAERLDKAALRTLRILTEVREDPDLFGQVKHSRYHTNVCRLLADELENW